MVSHQHYDEINLTPYEEDDDAILHNNEEDLKLLFSIIGLLT